MALLVAAIWLLSGAYWEGHVPWDTTRYEVEPTYTREIIIHDSIPVPYSYPVPLVRTETATVVRRETATVTVTASSGNESWSQGYVYAGSDDVLKDVWSGFGWGEKLFWFAECCLALIGAWTITQAVLQWIWPALHQGQQPPVAGGGDGGGQGGPGGGGGGGGGGSEAGNDDEVENLRSQNKILNDQVQDRDEQIVGLNTRIDGLVDENQEQADTIKHLKAKVEEQAEAIKRLDDEVDDMLKTGNIAAGPAAQRRLVNADGERVTQEDYDELQRNYDLVRQERDEILIRLRDLKTQDNEDSQGNDPDADHEKPNDKDNLQQKKRPSFFGGAQDAKDKPDPEAAATEQSKNVNDRDRLKQYNKELQNQVKALKQELKECQEHRGLQRGPRSGDKDLKDANEQSEADKRKLQHDYDALKNELEDTSRKLAECEAGKQSQNGPASGDGPSKGEFDKLKNGFDEREKEVKKLKGEAEVLSKELGEVKHKLDVCEQHKKQQAEPEKGGNPLKAEYDALQSQLHQLEEENEKLASDRDLLRIQLDDQTHKLERWKANTPLLWLASWSKEEERSTWLPELAAAEIRDLEEVIYRRAKRNHELEVTLRGVNRELAKCRKHEQEQSEVQGNDDQSKPKQKKSKIDNGDWAQQMQQEAQAKLDEQRRQMNHLENENRRLEHELEIARHGRQLRSDETANNAQAEDNRVIPLAIHRELQAECDRKHNEMRRLEREQEALVGENSLFEARIRNDLLNPVDVATVPLSQYEKLQMELRDAKEQVEEQAEARQVWDDALVDELFGSQNANDSDASIVLEDNYNAMPIISRAEQRRRSEARSRANNNVLRLRMPRVRDPAAQTQREQAPKDLDEARKELAKLSKAFEAQKKKLEECESHRKGRNSSQPNTPALPQSQSATPTPPVSRPSNARPRRLPKGVDGELLHDLRVALAEILNRPGFRELRGADFNTLRTLLYILPKTEKGGWETRLQSSSLLNWTNPSEAEVFESLATSDDRLRVILEWLSQNQELVIFPDPESKAKGKVDFVRRRPSPGSPDDSWQSSEDEDSRAGGDGSGSKPGDKKAKDQKPKEDEDKNDDNDSKARHRQGRGGSSSQRAGTADGAPPTSETGDQEFKEDSTLLDDSVKTENNQKSEEQTSSEDSTPAAGTQEAASDALIAAETAPFGGEPQQNDPLELLDLLDSELRPVLQAPLFRDGVFSINELVTALRSRFQLLPQAIPHFTASEVQQDLLRLMDNDASIPLERVDEHDLSLERPHGFHENGVPRNVDRLRVVPNAPLSDPASPSPAVARIYEVAQEAVEYIRSRHESPREQNFAEGDLFRSMDHPDIAHLINDRAKALYAAHSDQTSTSGPSVLFGDHHLPQAVRYLLMVDPAWWQGSTVQEAADTLRQWMNAADEVIAGDNAPAATPVAAIAAEEGPKQNDEQLSVDVKSPTAQSEDNETDAKSASPASTVFHMSKENTPQSQRSNANTYDARLDKRLVQPECTWFRRWDPFAGRMYYVQTSGRRQWFSPDKFEQDREGGDDHNDHDPQRKLEEPPRVRRWFVCPLRPTRDGAPVKTSFHETTGHTQWEKPADFRSDQWGRDDDISRPLGRHEKWHITNETWRERHPDITWQPLHSRCRWINGTFRDHWRQYPCPRCGDTDRSVAPHTVEKCPVPESQALTIHEQELMKLYQDQQITRDGLYYLFSIVGPGDQTSEGFFPWPQSTQEDEARRQAQYDIVFLRRDRANQGRALDEIRRWEDRMARGEEDDIDEADNEDDDNEDPFIEAKTEEPPSKGSLQLNTYGQGGHGLSSGPSSALSGTAPSFTPSGATSRVTTPLPPMVVPDLSQEWEAMYNSGERYASMTPAGRENYLRGVLSQWEKTHNYTPTQEQLDKSGGGQQDTTTTAQVVNSAQTSISGATGDSQQTVAASAPTLASPAMDITTQLLPAAQDLEDESSGELSTPSIAPLAARSTQPAVDETVTSGSATARPSEDIYDSRWATEPRPNATTNLPPNVPTGPKDPKSSGKHRGAVTGTSDSGSPLEKQSPSGLTTPQGRRASEDLKRVRSLKNTFTPRGNLGTSERPTDFSKPRTTAQEYGKASYKPAGPSSGAVNTPTTPGMMHPPAASYLPGPTTRPSENPNVQPHRPWENRDQASQPAQSQGSLQPASGHGGATGAANSLSSNLAATQEQEPQRNVQRFTAHMVPRKQLVNKLPSYEEIRAHIRRNPKGRNIIDIYLCYGNENLIPFFKKVREVAFEQGDNFILRDGSDLISTPPASPVRDGPSETPGEDSERSSSVIDVLDPITDEEICEAVHENDLIASLRERFSHRWSSESDFVLRILEMGTVSGDRLILNDDTGSKPAVLATASPIAAQNDAPASSESIPQTQTSAQITTSSTEPLVEEGNPNLPPANDQTSPTVPNVTLSTSVKPGTTAREVSTIVDQSEADNQATLGNDTTPSDDRNKDDLKTTSSTVASEDAKQDASAPSSSPEAELMLTASKAEDLQKDSASRKESLEASRPDNASPSLLARHIKGDLILLEDLEAPNFPTIDEVRAAIAENGDIGVLSERFENRWGNIKGRSSFWEMCRLVSKQISGSKFQLKEEPTALPASEAAPQPTPAASSQATNGAQTEPPSSDVVKPGMDSSIWAPAVETASSTSTAPAEEAPLKGSLQPVVTTPTSIGTDQASDGVVGGPQRAPQTKPPAGAPTDDEIIAVLRTNPLDTELRAHFSSRWADDNGEYQFWKRVHTMAEEEKVREDEGPKAGKKRAKRYQSIIRWKLREAAAGHQKTLPHATQSKQDPPPEDKKQQEKPVNPPTAATSSKRPSEGSSQSEPSIPPLETTKAKSTKGSSESTKSTASTTQPSSFPTTDELRAELAKRPSLAEFKAKFEKRWGNDAGHDEFWRQSKEDGYCVSPTIPLRKVKPIKATDQNQLRLPQDPLVVSSIRGLQMLRTTRRQEGGLMEVEVEATRVIAHVEDRKIEEDRRIQEDRIIEGDRTVEGDRGIGDEVRIITDEEAAMVAGSEVQDIKVEEASRGAGVEPEVSKGSRVHPSGGVASLFV
ncbi:hypothetical protein CLAFUW4_01953 [Fulvia fulva]|uniref:WW domain-containing protein n=1 Tax=Passalora fulva TaxID=5499 RepID=A0A9Q8P412_PASFU|nr:uncharacterized protein CLAFUR5_01947 [Fulvia fulva]KAK4635422.1 hypothetical protein CLAFUR4_01948 [Fulvia fulva]KAK4638694.1 hypothetical protein CLAFUR0_01950 [Fulvia fulva]UJO12493.1 hypothetical protein CLAFUR5_01947 [Fulvia fulva]WPV09590.1 hypothetical protein CLAFUW4_01953 [Fulvia fulva]WPV23640.1 hypothetical protein CLAFUW7_01952 [Fulvia fulva]